MKAALLGLALACVLAAQDMRAVHARAVAALEAGRLPEAEGAARELVQATGGNARALGLLATVCDAQGKLDEAENLFRKALGLGSPTIALLNNAGNHFLRRGRLADAESSFRGVLKLAPEHRNSRLGLARVLTARGEYGEAEGIAEALVAAAPQDAAALLALGVAAAHREHWARAQTALESALRIAGEEPEILFQLGRVHAAQRRYERASALLHAAAARAPARADVQLALARALEDGGYYGDAALAYDAYMALRPDDQQTGLERALIYARTGNRRAEGRVNLERHLSSHPDDATAHYYLGLAISTDEPVEALQSIDRALRLRPGYAEARYARANLLLNAGRLEEALADAHVVLAEQPGNPAALDLAGAALLALDRASEAEPLLRRARAAAPDSPDAAYHLARALLALGHEAEAEPLLAEWSRLKAAVKTTQRPGVLALLDRPAAEQEAQYLANLRAAVERRPGDSAAQLRLAEAEFASGNADAAVRLLRAIPAEAAADAGRLALASGQFALAAELLGRTGLPSLDLAAALFVSAGPDAALAVLERISAGGRDYRVHLLRARVLHAKGAGADARAALEAALASQPDDIAVQHAALLLAQNGAPDRALEIAGPDARGDLLALRAVVLESVGRRGDADQALAAAVRHRPESACVRHAAAAIARHRGETAKAEQATRTAELLGLRAQDPIRAAVEKLLSRGN